MYRSITTTFVARTGNAVCVVGPSTRGSQHVWIPRSVIHGADDVKVETAEVGETISVRVAEWKAEDLGFA